MPPIRRTPEASLMHTMKRLACLAAAVTCFTTLPSFADDPFGQIRVAANRSEFRGHCPVEVIFTGNIDFTMPHPRGFAMNYFWARSDGAKSRTVVVKPGPSQRMLVVREPWRLGANGQAYNISATLHVNSGNTHLRESSRTIHVECR